MVTNWAAEIPVSKDALRASLDLATVVYEELGATVGTDGQGNCPFHDDTRPSFGVFESDDGVERAGCWACGWRGDVFDVIQAARNCSFREACDAAREYVGRQTAVRRVSTVTVRKFDDEFWEARRRYETDPTPVIRFVQTKGYPWTAGWLHSRWNVGVAATAGLGSVFIPHFDAEGECTGFKHRTAYTPPLSASGSRFPALYGSWLDDETKPVVVTEGESDTWAVAWYVPEVVALGLPTGAGTPLRAEWLNRLSGREIIICFDGDDPGRTAAARWSAALPTARIVEMAEGVDAVAMGHKIRTAVLVG